MSSHEIVSLLLESPIETVWLSVDCSSVGFSSDLSVVDVTSSSTFDDGSSLSAEDVLSSFFVVVVVLLSFSLSVLSFDFLVVVSVIRSSILS